MNTYSEAMSWIHSRLKHGINLGLARMEWLLEKMGNPEKELKVIHVAGTNGKGSTVTFLRSILNEAGYEVGTFTSPYIETFNERISINGNPVSDADLVKLVRIVKPLTEELEAGELGPPTEFEIITAMAMYYFANIRPVDFTILEVGLGGRFDSTNTVHPLMTIITNIGMDHISILGDSIEKIAYEKAGIIKEGVPLFTGTKQGGALTVIQSEAQKKHAGLYILGTHFFVENHKSLAGGECFSFFSEGIRLDDLRISLLGRHQTENAALALASLFYLKKNGILHLTEEEVRAGLEKSYWPGRMEIVNQNPLVLLDGAHNADGLAAFVSTMQDKFEDKKIRVVFAALEDKDLSHMLPLLKNLNADVYLTEFDFPRAASASRLKEIGRMEDAIADQDWRMLVEKLIKETEPEDILAVTGSLYFISEVKPFIIKIMSD